MIKKFAATIFIMTLTMAGWACSDEPFEGTIEASVMFMPDEHGDLLEKDAGHGVMIHLWVGETFAAAAVIASHHAHDIPESDTTIAPQTIIAEFTDLLEGETYYVGVVGGGETYTADDHLFGYYNADSTNLVAESPTGMTLSSNNSHVSFSMMMMPAEHHAE